MTARHIYVDETKHRDYVMVAAVVLGEDTSPRLVLWSRIFSSRASTTCT